MSGIWRFFGGQHRGPGPLCASSRGKARDANRRADLRQAGADGRKPQPVPVGESVQRGLSSRSSLRDGAQRVCKAVSSVGPCRRAALARHRAPHQPPPDAFGRALSSTPKPDGLPVCRRKHIQSRSVPKRDAAALFLITVCFLFFAKKIVFRFNFILGSAGMMVPSKKARTHRWKAYRRRSP